MRLVLRVLLVECALSWAMLLAGYVRVALQIWPFATAGLTARFRDHDWRVGLLAGLPVVAGWPAMFAAPSVAPYVSGNWLNLAIPWWVLTGASGTMLLLARLGPAESRAEREAGCRCGTCMARVR